MELNFSELSDNNSNEVVPKYWEQQEINKENSSKMIKTQKKKVSFNDILTNMNLVVNQEGILQYITPAQTLDENNLNKPILKKNQYSLEVKKQEPLDPSVKHSHIYNKYFKDYKDINDFTPEVRVPKTIQEYHKMLYEDRLKVIEQQKRISEIKSKKLLFTSNVSNQRGMQMSKNNLGSMSFR
jgi:hypothetical protein